MTSPVSKHFTERQLRAIDKIGDTLLPGVGDLPSFSRVGASRHADRVLDHMPASDRKDLGLLLTLLSFLPAFFVGMFMSFLEMGAKLPGALGAGVRFVRLGLRGLVMTLYYCDEAVLKIIGYDAKVYVADFKPYVAGARPTAAPGGSKPQPNPTP